MKIHLDLFKMFSVGDRLPNGNLQLYPIDLELTKTPENIRSLPELLEEKSVLITETSQSGDVELVHVKNLSEHYLFILDGEALTGAKQNRISQRSVLIAPNSESEIPVNCVERSRWSPGINGSFNRGDFVLPPSARDKKSELMQRKMKNQIQNSVWNSVDELSMKHASFSPTSDLGEILDKSEDIAQNLHFSEINEIKCNGFIVYGAGRPFIELFFDKDICFHHQFSSRKGWLADAMTSQTKIKDMDPVDIIYKLKNTFWEQEEAVDSESAFCSNDVHNGHIILHNGAFVHGYFYL